MLSWCMCREHGHSETLEYCPQQSGFEGMEVGVRRRVRERAHSFCSSLLGRLLMDLIILLCKSTLQA